MNRFILDGRYGDLLSFFGISMEAALKKAQLPTDTFKRRNPTMTEEQYFRFMDAVGFLTTDPQMTKLYGNNDEEEIENNESDENENNAE